MLRIQASWSSQSLLSVGGPSETTCLLSPTLSAKHPQWTNWAGIDSGIVQIQERISHLLWFAAQAFLELPLPFWGSIFKPSEVSKCPTWGTCVWRILHFSLLSFKPCIATLSRNFCNHSSCVVSSPATTASSIMTSTASKSSAIRSMVLWNISGAHFTLKGSLVNLYRPMGVLNAHRREDSSSNFSCQKPLVASRMLTILAPWRRLATSSIVFLG